MKIAVVCNSILLTRALEIFLKPYLVPIKQADFVVCDYEASFDRPIFNPKKDVLFPFSKANLMLSIESFCKVHADVIKIKNELLEKEERDSGFAKLQTKINSIMKKYEDEILKTVREHYGR